MKRLFLMITALCALLPLSAVEITPMREVRDMVQKAKTMTVDHDLYIEGFIISHPQGKNNELNHVCG